MRLHFKLLLVVFTLTFIISSAANAQIVLGRPKDIPPLDNPYTINLTRADVTKAIAEILQTCKIELDPVSTKVDKGKFVTTPWIFAKGVNAKTDLEHVSQLPAGDARNWLKGRYALEINVLPLDDKRSQLQVITHIQGQIADVIGTRWIESPSNGYLEDEALRGLAGKILGIDLSIKGNAKRRLMNCEY